MTKPPSTIQRLFFELRRRRVFRTAALYIVGSWLVLQVSDVVFPALGLPEEALRYVLIAMVLGFPAALVFGWFFDISPSGIRRTAPAGAVDAGTAQALRKSDYLILAALVTVAGAIIYNTVGNVVDSPGYVRPADRTGPPMVAVLPFTTTSREGDSQFFATGVHDDLLTQLSKLQSIRVISRTSVMEYQDVARNIREIAAELGADVVMEGGIQVAGEMIRINAQLIDARTDAHLWADTYDRQLNATNIFELQSDISRAIADALSATLTPQDEDELSIIPTKNMAAYRAYRRAMDMDYIYQNPDYRAALEEAVRLDPGFTRAWAELAGHLSYINFWGEPNLEDIERAEEILEIVREQAPNSAEYLIALAYYSLYTLKDYDQAFEVITRAEEKAPSDLKVLGIKTWILRRQGRHAERNPVFRRILELDPKDVTTAGALANNLMVLHRYEEAAEFLEQSPFEGYQFSAMRATVALWEHGDFERYISEMIELNKEYSDEADSYNLWEAYFAARNLEAAEAMIGDLYDPRADNYPGIDPETSARLMTYWLMGDPERLQEALEDTYARFKDFGTEKLAAQDVSLNIDLALPAALEGDVEKSVRLVNRWRQNAESEDATGYIHVMPYACRTLAIANAVAETVDCLRRGFTEPSYMKSFIEPYLPYYDPIRESPEFQALFAEFTTRH